MLYRFVLFLVAFSAITAQAQYKNDNVKYQTVFMEDLCAALKNNPGYLILDVRSKGEYNDTSSSVNYNIGHLKNATNIDIGELDKRLAELKDVKDKPVFIYCSHSQRSRRASTLLADSGFSKIFNINGGLTAFNLLKETGIPCSSVFYETNNQYKLISPLNLTDFLKKEKELFILDVRKDSVFNGVSSDEKLNAYGKLKNAVNIPFAALANSLQQVPKNKSILIVDDFGSEAPKAAQVLLNNGYTNIHVLFNGMDMWNSLPAAELPEKNKYWNTNAGYKMINADEFDELAKKNKDMLILDVRIAEEFNNLSKTTWRNRGNIKNAKNIPSGELASRLNEIGAYKDKPIIIYHFSSGTEAFASAKMLTEKGFTNVHVLVGGIWNLRWRAANIKDKAYLEKWVENVPAENL